MPESNRRTTTWRARRLKDKSWVLGQLVEFNNCGRIYESFDLYHEVDITTKGMSIGIKDKNGKDVFEGDLLISINDISEYGTYVVVHRGCGFVGKHYNTECYIDLITHDIEVVGVYYSSELERELKDIKEKIELLTYRESGDASN
jgi:hypothetical protein